MVTSSNVTTAWWGVNDTLVIDLGSVLFPLDAGQIPLFIEDLLEPWESHGEDSVYTRWHHQELIQPQVRITDTIEIHVGHVLISITGEERDELVRLLRQRLANPYAEEQWEKDLTTDEEHNLDDDFDYSQFENQQAVGTPLSFPVTTKGKGHHDLGGAIPSSRTGATSSRTRC